MKVMARYGFILGLICILAAGLLAIVNSLTQPKIFAQNKQQEKRGLSEVLPEAVRFEEIKSASGEILYYQAYNQNNEAAGIAFKAAGKGYSSTIETMVGMDTGGNISVIKVLSQSETPGLGSRVAEAPFIAQFRGKNISELGDIQAITGATISSQALIDSVRNKAKEIRSLIKNGK